jgi:2-amino-4-hydroxy-6-hydroxymethyldihydropteridine diphosphokinase
MLTNVIYFSLGSNIGDKLNHIELAIQELALHTGEISKKSSLYATEPWGKTNQEDFLNQIVAIKTGLTPENLLKKILTIEIQLGRIRNKRNDPRTIDIDILMYNDLVIATNELIVPHPRMHLRNFVLIPMTEIAPAIVHPVFKKTMLELLDACKDNSHVKKMNLHEIKSE